MTTMGAECAAFEAEFADYIGTRHAVMVNSGSSANLLMVAALRYLGELRSGDAVAVPAMSWNTTYAPLQQFGLKMALVDVDDSLTIDVKQIPSDVAAVFGVNLLGNSCDYDQIRAPIILEDNCEALGAEYKGRLTGSIGRMASHSLFFSHHMSTMEGGVITTDDSDLRDVLVSLRAHGWGREWPDYDSSDFDARFRFYYPGFSVRPTEVQGAIGRVQLRKLPQMLDDRRRNGAMYKKLIGHQREIGLSSWFGFPVLADDRPGILAALPNIEARPVVAGNIQRHPVASWYGIDSANCPVADQWHARGFFVGNNPGISASLPLAQIAKALRGANAS